MYRIIFIAVGGGEREIVVVANSETAAMKFAATRDDLALIFTCTRLDSVEDSAVQDRRRRLSQMAA